jgi:hypothetical protein
MHRKLKAETAIGLTALFTAQAMIPTMRSMPSACVVEKANDFGPPVGCDDLPFAPKAAVASVIATSTSTTQVAHPQSVIQHNAITDAEYLIDFPTPARILVQPST